jgi:hypothetical protein
MPLAADPNALQRIVLDSDKDKSPQPAFIYRYLTYRRWVEFQTMQEELNKADAMESIRRQFEAMADGLVCWEHINDPQTGQPLAFDRNKMPDIVTLYEAQEILMKRMKQSVPGVEDKKKLLSPSESDTESCVKDAKA